MKSDESLHRAIIMGASSGLGYETARILLSEGWRLGLAARHTDKLAELASEYPGKVEYMPIDITADIAGNQLRELIGKLGGMELYLHIAGVGWQNMTLKPEKELATVNTNSLGFARMVGEAYRYFAEKGHGHIAVISSIAGTKGLGAAPAYSATKAFDSVYIQALEQQAHMRHLPIKFTDIRPGFAATALINDGSSYPMVMSPEHTASLIVKAIRKEKHVSIIDWRWNVLTALWRRVPRWLWRRMNIHN